MSLNWKPRKKVWANHCNKNVFNPETFEAFSYNWWKYVTKVKGQIVFNDHSYSVTTNKHQGEMRHLLRTELGLNLENIIFVNQRESLSSGIYLDSYYETLALAEVRLKATGRRAAFYADQKSIIENCKKNIAILRKLGAKAKIKLVNYRVNAKNSETERLERQRVKSQAARVARQAVLTEFKSQYESTSAVEV